METLLTNSSAIRSAASHEEDVRRISEGRVYVLPGQMWLGNGTTQPKFITREEQKLSYGCNVNKDHPSWRTIPNNILQGRGCPACMAAAAKARQDAITAAFVGQTTADGHLILEHTGYHQAPSNKKKGNIGQAKFRYRCGRCGGEGEALGNNLKRPGHTPGCKNCSTTRRETLNTFIWNPDRANSLAMLYICPVFYDTLTKIGITNNFTQRATVHEVVYDGAYFVSHLLPRAWVWVIEQILLKETKAYQVKAKEIPPEMTEKYWGGTTELRNFNLDPEVVEARFFELLYEIQDLQGNWVKVYKDHIKN